MKKTRVLRNFWYSLTANQRFLIRRVYYFPIDLWDKLTGKTNKYVPSRGLIYTGSPASAEKYIEQGLMQLNTLKKEINLQPNDSVLDIGSGVGRTAIALTTCIDKTGSYDGFDVVKEGVDWCNARLGKDYPNFKFKYVSIYNDLYNKSLVKTAEFKFPYDDNCFSKVISFSLFTHMQISEIQHYFFEIQRVLKPDGLCLSTFFLYNDEEEDYVSSNADFAFPYKKDNYRLMNQNVKSGNIAIHKDKIKSMLKNANLECVKISDGFWKNDDNTTKEYQDIVIFKKI